jgi:hypothetical protein
MSATQPLFGFRCCSPTCCAALASAHCPNFFVRCSQKPFTTLEYSPHVCWCHASRRTAIREMARVVRVGGYVYVNAPSTGYWHGFPDDNYRFYRGAVAALAFWCGHRSEHTTPRSANICTVAHLGCRATRLRGAAQAHSFRQNVHTTCRCGKAFGGAPAYPLRVESQHFEREPPFLDNVMVWERTSTPAVNFTLGRLHDANDPHSKHVYRKNGGNRLGQQPTHAV